MATWKKVLTEEAIATGTSLGTSNALVPSQNAVKTYVDANTSNITVDTSITNGGTNPVDSDAIFDALAGKEDVIDASNRLSATLIGSNGNVSNSEFGFLSGVTSDIQTQLANKQGLISGAATTITTSNLTTSRALVSNSSGKVQASSTTTTELGYLNSVTSDIQTQLNGKQASGSYAALAGSTSQNFSTNDLAVTGNLTVTGTIDTVSSTNSTLVDKTITLSSGATTESAASISGLEVNTGQTLEPHFLWTEQTGSPNTTGRVGSGWAMGTLVETQSATTNMSVMGCKIDAGAPGATDKAQGEGTFYWDSTNSDLYVCTNSFTNSGGA